MIKFIRNIRKMRSTLTRINNFERDFEERITGELKNFEEKIKNMSFDYTANLDDAKTNYLKLYLETRMDCLQKEIMSIPKKLQDMQSNIRRLEESLCSEANEMI